MEKNKTNVDEFEVGYAHHRHYSTDNWALLMLIALMSVTCYFSAQAQQSNAYLNKKNQFRVGVGVGCFKVADYQFSSKVYQTLQEHIKLGYSNAFKKNYTQKTIRKGIRRIKIFIVVNSMQLLRPHLGSYVLG